MKERAASTKNTIFTILLFPIIFIFLVGLLIITPFDCLKYKKTQYYRDTHEKYSWLCTSSYYIKFYDLIKNEKLPIDYFRCDHVSYTGYGYFIYKDILILNDYYPCFDDEQNIWMVESGDEYVDIKDDVDDAIERCNNFLKEDVCKSAVVLIDSEVYNEHPNMKYDKFSFVPVNNDDTIEALKMIIK